MTLIDQTKAQSGDKSQSVAQINPVGLYASVGLMMDLDRSIQLYHAWRVALVSFHLAEVLHSFEAPLVFIGSMLADCGAIHLQEHITQELVGSPSSLSQKSDIHIFFHPVVGYEMLRGMPGMRNIGQIVLQHHEDINGGGYPAGLKGDEIDLSSQIVRIADQLDILLRSDQPGNEKEVQLALTPFVGEAFSAQMLDALMTVLAEKLSFGKLLRPESIAMEVESVASYLAKVTIFEGSDVSDWENTIEGLADMIDSRHDQYTRGHSNRVAKIGDAIATTMGLGDVEKREVRWSSRLMNMGEVAMRHLVIGKSGKLGEQEREFIRMHPAIGHDLLRRVDGLDRIARIIRHHHENWDGSGYPENLGMEEIPAAARIVRVADAFDAMISERPYKRKRDWKHAIKELKRHAGTHFDPVVVDAALQTMNSK